MEDLEQYAADYHDPTKYIATCINAASVDGEYVGYYEKTPKEYGKLHELTDIAAERIIGKWDTMYIRRGYDGPWEELSGYNITFLADGTFTSDLGGNHAGTWSYDFAAEYNFGTYYNLRYSDGTCVSVEITKTGFDLRVGESQYFIKCINEEMDNAVAEAHVVGEWLQFDGPVVDADTGAYSGKVVFSSDGSFVADLEEEIRGTWSVASVDTYPDAVRSPKEEILPEIYLEMECSDPKWTIENPQILAEVYLYFELNGNGTSNVYMFQE